MDELFLLNQQLKSSGDKLTEVYNNVVEMQDEMRQSSRDLYFRLSLLSGGIISLSVTYIGYLSSLPRFSINYAELLFGGWIALGMAVIGGVYRNHFNLDMGHWQTMETLNKARLENDKATLALMEKNPQQFVNPATSGIGVEEETIKKMKERIKKIEDAIKSCVAKNKENEKLWQFFQRAAHMGFILGVILIIFFASLNIPVPIHFSLIENFEKIIK